VCVKKKRRRREESKNVGVKSFVAVLWFVYFFYWVVNAIESGRRREKEERERGK